MIRLSRREREIADLVALGLTNREIGDRLFISERTAEGHIQQVRNKLGFTSRTQIAAWAVQQKPEPGDDHAAAQPVGAMPGPRSLRVDNNGWIPIGRLRRRWLAVVAALLLAAAVIASLRLLPQPLGTQRSEPGPVFALAVGVVEFQVGSIAVDRGGSLYLPLIKPGPAPIPGVAVLKISSRGQVETAVPNIAAGAVALDGGSVLYIAGFETDFQGYALPNLGGILRFDGHGLTKVAGQFDGSLADGVPAITASLEPGGVQAIAFDPSGELYISAGQKIRKVTASGLIFTVVGAGTQGYSGDGGPPLLAQLNTPTGMAFNRDGELHFADRFNHAVRKLGRDGKITTVAGTGRAGFSGDGGPAAAARLNSPHSVAFDAAGNLYISDTDNNVIRKVSPSGIMSTVIGSSHRGSALEGRTLRTMELSSPSAIAFDTAGRLYIVDTFNRRVLRVLLRP